MKCDVVVVGAGPAGAMAAFEAAKKDVRVILIDKKRDIGNPVRCGEAISEEVLRDLNIDIDEKWALNFIDRIKIIWSDGDFLEFRTPINGIILDRTEFEKMLVERALEEGVELMLGKTVTGLSKEGIMIGKEEIKSKVIIGADGIESRIGRWAGLVNRLRLSEIGIAAQHTIENLELEEHCMELYLGKKYTPNGYAWVFPKGRNLANVGIGYPGNVNADLNRSLERFLSIRAPSGTSLRHSVGCVPITLPVKKSVKDNVMIVGDAARQVNALGGAGIANALVAGIIAGNVAGEVVAKNRPIKELEMYDKLWRRRLERRLKMSYRMRWITTNASGKEENLFRMLKPLALMSRIMSGAALRPLGKVFHY